MPIAAIIERALQDEILTPDEVAALFDVPHFADEWGLIAAAARRKAAEAAADKAEVHAQVGVDIAPCPRDCLWCAFAVSNKLFKERVELSTEEVVARSRRFEEDGANAVYFMVTAGYAWGRLIELLQEVRGRLHSDTVMVVNVDDFSFEQARQLVDAGVSGVYHAVRLGEGVDNRIPVETRLESMRNAREAGLKIGTCLEAIGPDHTTGELVEKTLLCRDAEPVYAGAARRILLPETVLYRRGTVSETRMVHCVSVVRLVLPRAVMGNCTHEPFSLGAAHGASLFWAESGSNPRDTEKETEGKHGLTVQDCRAILKEADWGVLDGPSRWY